MIAAHFSTQMLSWLWKILPMKLSALLRRWRSSLYSSWRAEASWITSSLFWGLSRLPWVTRAFVLCDRVCASALALLYDRTDLPIFFVISLMLSTALSSLSQGNLCGCRNSSMRVTRLAANMDGSLCAPASKCLALTATAGVTDKDANVKTMISITSQRAERDTASKISPQLRLWRTLSLELCLYRSSLQAARPCHDRCHRWRQPDQAHDSEVA